MTHLVGAQPRSVNSEKRQYRNFDYKLWGCKVLSSFKPMASGPFWTHHPRAERGQDQPIAFPQPSPCLQPPGWHWETLLLSLGSPLATCHSGPHSFVSRPLPVLCSARSTLRLVPGLSPNCSLKFRSRITSSWSLLRALLA